MTSPCGKGCFRHIHFSPETLYTTLSGGFRLISTLTSLCILFSQTLVGQDFAFLNNPGFTSKTFGIYDTHNAYTDQHGFIWLASNNDGLFRYDGRSPERILLHSDPIRNQSNHGVQDIGIDSVRNIIWICAIPGVYTYDLLTGKIERNIIPDRYSELDNMKPTHVFQENDEVWIFFDGNQFLNIFPDDDSRIVVINDRLDTSLTEDLKLAVHVTTSVVEKGLYYFFGRKGIVYFRKDNRVETLMQEELTALGGLRQVLHLNDDRFLFSAWKQGLYIYDAGARLLQPLFADRLGTIPVQGMHRFSDTTIYVGTALSNFRYNPNRHTMTALVSEETDYRKFQGIEMILNNDIVIELSGPFMHSSSYAHQISHAFIPEQLRTVESRHPERIVYHDGKAYLIFYYGPGVYCFDQKTLQWKLYRAPASLKATDGIDFQDLIYWENGTFLGITANTIFEFQSNGTFKLLHRATTDVDGNYKELAKDRHGNLWIGTRNRGVKKFNYSSGTMSTYHSELSDNDSELHQFWSSEIMVDQDDQVWIRNEDGFSVIHIPTNEINNYFFRDSLFSNFDHISDITETEDAIWIMGNAITEIDKKSHQIRRSQFHYDLELRNNQISAFALQNGNLIFSDPLLTIFKPSTNSIVPISRSCGYRQVWVSPELTVHNDTVWMAHRSGISWFVPDQIREPAQQPNPYIKQIKVNNETLSSYVPFHTTTDLRLSPGTYLVQFDFAAIDFESNEPFQFQYALDENPPIFLEKEQTISLSNLNFGWHTIALFVRHTTSEWNPAPYHLRFYNAPFWYQSRLFKAALAILTLGILTIVALGRIRQQRNMARQKLEALNIELRALQTQIKPHFIFNCINTIDGFIAGNNRKEASLLIGQLSKLIRHSLEFSREEMITVSEELEFVKMYLNLERKRIANPFTMKMEINWPQYLEVLAIPPLTIQPLVENALWHGIAPLQEPGELIISDALDETHYTITIRDNGMGYLPDKFRKPEHTSLGSSIIRERLAVINRGRKVPYRLVIQNRGDLPGEHRGTQASLCIPLRD